MVVIQDCLVEDHVWVDLVDPLGSLHGLLDRLLGELGSGHILGGSLLRGSISPPSFSSECLLISELGAPASSLSLYSSEDMLCSLLRGLRPGWHSSLDESSSTSSLTTL